MALQRGEQRSAQPPPAPASQLSPACTGLTSTVSGFCTYMLFSWLHAKFNPQCHFLECFPFFFLFLDVSRYAQRLIRELKIPMGRTECFSQKRNQNEPITIKLLQTWMEFYEYLIPQPEASQHHPAPWMNFSSNALCVVVLICMLARTFINLTYFLRLVRICVWVDLGLGANIYKQGLAFY